MTRSCLLALLIACAHPAPRAPSPGVRDEIGHAEAAERRRQHADARVHYQRAIGAATDPTSVAFARRAYAGTLASWGEFPEAIAQLEVVVRVEPDDAASWHDLGLLLHNRGENARAIEALELELPQRLRGMVAWAIRTLDADLAGRPSAEPPPQ